MKSDTINRQNTSPKKGSTIIMVLLVLTGVSIILGSAISLTLTEKRVNIRHMLRHESLMAAESLSEYVFAEVMDRFEIMSSTYLVNTSLQSDPISLSGTSDFKTRVSNFYNGTNIDLSQSEIILGEIPDTAEEVYIAPTFSNTEDPWRERSVKVRELEVLVKVVADDTTRTLRSGEKDVVAYSREILEIRDAPLLSHAIFYNMDLELHPGPTMNIYGPVHSNTNMYVNAVGSLTFHGGISVSDKFLHAYKPDGTATYDSGNPAVYYPGDPTHQGGSVKIVAEDGTTQNVKKSDGTIVDHMMADWEEESDDVFGASLKDSAHGVHTYNPIGIPDYVPSDMTKTIDPSTNTNVISNYAYALIEPVLTQKNSNYTGDSGGGTLAEESATNTFEAVRKEKFAYKASLVFKVSGSPRTSASGDLSNESNYTASDYKISAWKYDRDANGDPIIDYDPATGAGTGLPKMTQVKLPAGLIGSTAADLRSVTGHGEVEKFSTSDSGSHTTGDVASGLYDHREDKGLDMVALDMNKLRELVDNTAPGYVATSDPSNPWKTHNGPSSVVDPFDPTGAATLAAPTAEFDPETDWNGVVYIQVPTEQHPASTTDTPPRSDKIVSGSDQYLGVQIINGKYDASTGAGGAPAPTHDDDTPIGLTIATNAPAYTIGHINANGVAHTDDAAELDRSDEPPMAIVADAVTVLSENWYPGTSDNRKDSNESNTGNRGGTFTEVSTAIITGLKPTIPFGTTNSPAEKAISGGAHNFPRFLEKWSNTLTIRGSLVSLWESEVHERAMPGNFGHYYSPPTRDWGFNKNFENGIYPPGATTIRGYSRLAIGQISKAEYEARKTALTATPSS